MGWSGGMEGILRRLKSGTEEWKGKGGKGSETRERGKDRYQVTMKTHGSESRGRGHEHGNWNHESKRVWVLKRYNQGTSTHCTSIACKRQTSGWKEELGASHMYVTAVSMLMVGGRTPRNPFRDRSLRRGTNKKFDQSHVIVDYLVA